MNGRRVGLVAAAIGVAALVQRRLKTQTDAGGSAEAFADAPTPDVPTIDDVAASDTLTTGITAGSAADALGSVVDLGSPEVDGAVPDADLGSPAIGDLVSVAGGSSSPASNNDLSVKIPNADASAVGTSVAAASVAADVATSSATTALADVLDAGAAPLAAAAGPDASRSLSNGATSGSGQSESVPGSFSSPSVTAPLVGAAGSDSAGSGPDKSGPATAALPPLVGASTATSSPTEASAALGDRFVPAAEVEPPRPSWYRRKGWRIFGGLMGGLIIAAFIAASAIRLPYYSLSPGAVYDTIERVEAPGDLVSIPEGEIGFVTVAQTANITPWQWLDAKLDSNVRIRHEDEVQGNQTADELREADLRRMQISKNDAVIVALQRLGYDLEITPLGIEVASVFDCTAADGTLGTGDLIVGVNGVDVRSGEQLVAELAQIGIGEDVELLVERIDPNNPTQSMRTDLVGLTLGSADAECLPDDIRAEEPRPFIGIGTHTLVDENFPIDVDVRTGRVSGPSAGLAFTLAIMDVLSEGELTNGLNIVATGTINRDGQVGPVGGIHQKTVAAERSGADLFLVPLCCDNFVDSTTGEPLDLPSNYEEALEHADDMIVVGVENLDDALIAIGELGGDVDAFLNQ